MSHIERRGFCNRCGLCELGGPQHFITWTGTAGDANAAMHELIKDLHNSVAEAVVLAEWQATVPEMTLEEMRGYLDFPKRPEAVMEGCNYSFHVVDDVGGSQELPPKRMDSNGVHWEYPAYDSNLVIQLNDRKYGEP